MTDTRRAPSPSDVGHSEDPVENIEGLHSQSTSPDGAKEPTASSNPLGKRSSQTCLEDLDPDPHPSSVTYSASPRSPSSPRFVAEEEELPAQASSQPWYLRAIQSVVRSITVRAAKDDDDHPGSSRQNSQHSLERQSSHGSWNGAEGRQPSCLDLNQADGNPNVPGTPNSEYDAVGGGRAFIANQIRSASADDVLRSADQQSYTCSSTARSVTSSRLDVHGGEVTSGQGSWDIREIPTTPRSPRFVVDEEEDIEEEQRTAPWYLRPIQSMVRGMIVKAARDSDDEGPSPPRSPCGGLPIPSSPVHSPEGAEAAPEEQGVTAGGPNDEVRESSPVVQQLAVDDGAHKDVVDDGICKNTCKCSLL